LSDSHNKIHLRLPVPQRQKLQLDFRW